MFWIKWYGGFVVNFGFVVVGCWIWVRCLMSEYVELSYVLVLDMVFYVV